VNKKAVSHVTVPPAARYTLYGLGLVGAAAAIWAAFSKAAAAATTALEESKGVNAWGGSQRVAERALRYAAARGIKVTSTKRDDTATLLAGSTKGSDHHTGNAIAYAIDFGTAAQGLAAGDALFGDIVREFGIPALPGSYTRYNITDGGKTYSIQLLWRVPDHFNHVHLGVRLVQSSGAPGIAGLTGLFAPS